MTVRLTFSLSLLAVALACAAAPVARGESSAAVRVSLEDDRLVMTDRATGATLLATDDLDFHFELGRRRATVEPEIDLQPRDNGFDLVAVFQNNRAVPMPMGAIQLDGLHLSDGFRWRDFNSAGRSKEADVGDPRERFRFGYPHGPNGHYSPVAVVETDDVAIGFSLLYPLMDYRQTIRAELARENGAAPTWRFRWKLSNLGSENQRRRMDHEGILAPGERRTFTLAVRVASDPERWLETLEPYRTHFHHHYGGVAYERDARPVKGVTLAGRGNLSRQNPYGFRQEQYRPDLHGFGPLLEWIGATFDLGPRVMIWQPSGLQRRNLDNNMPFKMTSFWQEGDRHGHAMGDAVEEFRRFAARNNLELGFWWGRSTRVAREWDVAEHESLDPSDPEHRELAFRELDNAVAAGATMIGLDAFGDEGAVPVWELVEWMQIMRERYPMLKFITEKHKPDILHRLGPTFYQAYRKHFDDPQNVDDMRLIETPHYLADFLLPGHETWLSQREVLLERAPDVESDEALMRSEYERALSWGYIPLVLGNVSPDRADRAVESWRFTVPEGIEREPAIPESPQEAGPEARAPQLSAEAPRRGVKTHRNKR